MVLNLFKKHQTVIEQVFLKTGKIDELHLTHIYVRLVIGET